MLRTPTCGSNDHPGVVVVASPHDCGPGMAEIDHGTLAVIVRQVDDVAMGRKTTEVPCLTAQLIPLLQHRLSRWVNVFEPKRSCWRRGRDRRESNSGSSRVVDV